MRRQIRQMLHLAGLWRNYARVVEIYVDNEFYITICNVVLSGGIPKTTLQAETNKKYKVNARIQTSMYFILLFRVT